VYRDSEPSLPSDVGTAERAIAGTYAGGTYFQPLPGRSSLLAFDARSGRILWEFRSLGPLKMSPLYYKNTLYAGGSSGVLYTLSASGGKILNLRTFRQPFGAAPPLLVGKTLLFAVNRIVHAVPLESLLGKEQ
jgi:outer membrane protein assembly factor BamB